MSKIKLEDDFITMFTKMSEGNIGGLTVLMSLFKETPTIDPQSGLGGLGPILMMDDMGIYGSHIWILFKDICGENIHSMIALLRAHQLGFVSEAQLKSAINTCEMGRRGNREPLFDIPAIVAKVQEELVDFKPANALKVEVEA
jgi:hypothetical protein